MKLTLLCGTNRPGSNTRKITGQLAGIYAALGQPAEILDLAELPPEIFLPASYAKKPAAFARFSEAILASDGVHIVTPEYNGGMPGVLKYFIDMLKFPESFEHRPVAFTGLSAGRWGGLRPVEQLAAVFSYRNAHLFPGRVFLPEINEQLSPDGRVTNEDSLDRLNTQAKGFVAFIGKLR